MHHVFEFPAYSTLIYFRVCFRRVNKGCNSFTIKDASFLNEVFAHCILASKSDIAAHIQ